MMSPLNHGEQVSQPFENDLSEHSYEMVGQNDDEAYE